MTDHFCSKCSAQLTSDEIALHMKIQGRASKSYLCLDCQARFCNTTREWLEHVIERYKAAGTCALFCQEQEW